MDDARYRQIIERGVPELAEQLWSEFQLEERLEPYHELRYDGRAGDRPVLNLEDVSAIPFVEAIPGVAEYQHRARVRARSKDLFAAVTPPAEGYESYCREKLGLGSPEMILTDPGSEPMAVASACGDGRAFDRITEYALENDGLLLHPYMAIEDVWELGRKLRGRGVDASVIGPPPPVLWMANDKSVMVSIVNRLLGPQWNVETQFADSADAAANQLMNLAPKYSRVGIKRTRCSSATGNIVFESDSLIDASSREVHTRVEKFLDRTGWEPTEELLVVEWANVQHSPSTQMWLPPRSDGAPRLDGIYQQLLMEEHGVFQGSHPSTLPEETEREIAQASMALAAVFQRLGYVGRCSFDFILTGSATEPEALNVQFVECNGRWGGTSTPMHLVDRVWEGNRPPYLARDFVDPELEGASFVDVLEAVEPHLYDRRTGEGRLLFYNVGPLEQNGKLDVIGLGRTQEEAEESVEDLFPRLLDID